MKTGSRCTLLGAYDVSDLCLQTSDRHSWSERESGQVHAASGHGVPKLWPRSGDLLSHPALQGGGKGCSTQLHNRPVEQLAKESRNRQLLEAMPGQVRQDKGRRLNGACGTGQRRPI